MSTTITDTLMTSDQTQHTARWATDPPGGWVVSWLPGRRLDRSHAITAMTLAEEVAREAPAWPLVTTWATELGLTYDAALTRLAVA